MFSNPWIKQDWKDPALYAVDSRAFLYPTPHKRSQVAHTGYA